MTEFSPVEQHCLRAAEGWLELGSPHEAEAELAGLSPAAQRHPTVLELRWQIHARHGQWDAGEEVARALTKIAPHQPVGWIHLSYALHELKRTQEAWDNLLAAVAVFPDEPTMPYNLACYACQLGNPAGARHWLKRALKLDHTNAVKPMALADPDLRPLWPEITEL